MLKRALVQKTYFICGHLSIGNSKTASPALYEGTMETDAQKTRRGRPKPRLSLGSLDRLCRGNNVCTVGNRIAYSLRFGFCAIARDYCICNEYNEDENKQRDDLHGGNL